MKETKLMFQQEAKSIVDGFFSNRLFKDDISRDDMNSVEKFIGEMMLMRYEAQVRAENLLKSLEKNKK